MASFQSEFRRREGRIAALISRVSPLGVYALVAASGMGVLSCAHLFLINTTTLDAFLISTLFYIVMTVLFGGLLHATYPHATLGLCNVVTLVRLVFVSSLVTLLFLDTIPAWLVVGLSAIVLALDGVDGWLARRDKLVSEFGARFDVEVDSAFALILALHAFVDGKAGPLVLLLGLARYGFVVAGLVFPWLNRTLPERFSRKVICVVQLVALIALQLPFVTPPFSTLLVVATVAAVLWSFGRDVIWLRRSKA